jgi:hypothetical protein
MTSFFKKIILNRASLCWKKNLIFMPKAPWFYHSLLVPTNDNQNKKQCAMFSL